MFFCFCLMKVWLVNRTLGDVGVRPSSLKNGAKVRKNWEVHKKYALFFKGWGFGVCEEVGMILEK